MKPLATHTLSNLLNQYILSQRQNIKTRMRGKFAFVIFTKEANFPDTATHNRKAKIRGSVGFYILR